MTQPATTCDFFRADTDARRAIYTDTVSATVKDATATRHALAIESAQKDCDEACARIASARMEGRDA